MDVSIIIINYNTFYLTKQCINSIIEKSHGFSYEIIVVDNSCNKSEFNLLKTLENNFIKVITKNENLGTSKANNYGAQESNGKYLLFLNNDTYLLNNAIFEMISFAKKSNAKVVGGNMYDMNLNPTHSFIRDKFDYNYIKKSESIVSKIKHFIFKNKNSQQFEFSNKPIKINGYICGADLLIETNLFKKIKGFDEEIFMYGEDPLLCHNARIMCKEDSYIVPTSKIVHLEGRSDTPIFSDSKIYNIIFGTFTYLRKAYSINDGKKYLKYKAITGRIKFILYFGIDRRRATNQLKICKASKKLLSSINNELYE